MSNGVLELHKGEHSIRGYRCAYDDELFPCNTVKAEQSTPNLAANVD